MIVLLVIVLGALFYVNAQQVKEEERQWQVFLNHFYFSIDRSIHSIDQLMDRQDDVDQLENQIRYLERNLLEAEAILRYGRLFLDDELYHSNFFISASHFLYGIKMTGTVNAELPPMGENGQLSESDIIILHTIRESLNYARQEMYSEQTRQENPNLTHAEINEIFTNHLLDSSADIYQEAFE